MDPILAFFIVWALIAIGFGVWFNRQLRKPDTDIWHEPTCPSKGED